MEEVSVKLASEFDNRTTTTTITSTLAFGLLAIFFIWLVQYHWRRRRLYSFAAKGDGPPTYPLIGNALWFAGSTSDILYNTFNLGTLYKSPIRVWLGNRLFFAIVKPPEFEIILNSPHALQKEQLYKFAEPVVGTGLFTASVPKWKRHRKIIMPTFNQRILDGFVDVFVEQSEILVEQLRKYAGKGCIDCFVPISNCTLDIICNTAMGISVNAQTSESDYVKWANRAMHIVFTRMFHIWYHFDFVFNHISSMGAEYADIAEKLHNFTGSVVKEKREEYQRRQRENRDRPEALFEDEPRKKTFLDALIELSESGAKFTDEELREEVDTFMIAGSDTTASMNSFVFIMLGMFPDFQEKVYEEIIDIVGPDRQVDHTDLAKFKYMEKVIKETMRLFPVGPILVRAIAEDIPVGDCIIPKGSSVALLILNLHRDPELWPDPLRFDPERWNPEEIAKRHPYSWLPFSGGPRNCVGPKYAMMAMKALIATVVRKYRVSTDYATPKSIYLKADLMVKPVDGYKVAFELRET